MATNTIPGSAQRKRLMTTPTADLDRFFMTRQAANILEDMARQQSQPQTVNLLYGDTGVGKTRLLQEFVTTRVSLPQVTQLQFIEGGECQNTAPGQADIQAFHFSTDTLRSINAGSIVLIDQFEYAPSDSQRQILDYWGKNSRQLNIKLVLSGSRRIIDDLRNQSIPGTLAVSSVELKPLTQDESVQFVSHLACKDIHQSVDVTRDVKSRLKLTRGYFSELRGFVEQ